MIKTLILAIAVTLTLSACGSRNIEGDLTPQARIYQLQSDFATAVETVNQYASQPFCSDTNVAACAEREVVIEMNDKVQQVDSALDKARAAAQSGITDKAANYASIGRSMLTELKRLLVKHAGD